MNITTAFERGWYAQTLISHIIGEHSVVLERLNGGDRRQPVDDDADVVPHFAMTVRSIHFCLSIFPAAQQVQRPLPSRSYLRQLVTTLPTSEPGHK
jgi:hypothetical protein